MLTKGPPTSQNFFLNNNSKNVIKSVFNVNLHYNPIKVQVEEGLDAKKNGHIASKGWYSKLMGG